MTNTLTWIIKPIQLPKLNSNLLSVISLTLLFAFLFTMIYPAVEARASHCDEIKKELGMAITAELFAIAAAKLLWEVWKSAMDSGNFWGILAASIALTIAAAAVVAAGVWMTQLYLQLKECEEEHQSANAADAGGCDSGGCVT